MSRRKRYKKPEEGIEYWKSSSDLMTALILVLLLVIMFLVLYILEMPDQELVDINDNEYEEMSIDEGDEHVENDETDKEETDHDYDGNDDDNDDDGRDGDDGGGDDGGGDDGDGDGEDDPGEGDGSKSAVLASLVDAETGKAIPAKDVTFELYSDSKALCVLNTYYPKKKSYRTFKTTEEGEFFLPEKVLATKYYFHQLSDLNGYDVADKVDFEIDGPYDWPDPFLVKIPMYPMRDVIRIQMIDKDNGQAVGGGEFEVIAEEDITTKDDTIRVKKGEVAGKIICDDKGYGESKRLYLGKYKVQQSGIPEYYASSNQAIDVTLKDLTSADDKNTKIERGDSDDEVIEAENTVNTVRAERTRITFMLSDELTGDPVSGAVFEVIGPNINEEMTTDASGEIVLDEVEKNSTYDFTEVSAPGDYIAAIKPVSVKVSSKGRINGEAKGEIEATNRILRLDVGVRDVVLRSHLADTKVELFTAGGKLVETWTTNGSFTEITGLETGKYYINLNDDDSKKYNLTVTDTAEQQIFNINIFTTRSYAAIGGIAVAAVALIAGLIALIRRARRRRKEEARRAASMAAENADDPISTDVDSAKENADDGGGQDA